MSPRSAHETPAPHIASAGRRHGFPNPATPAGSDAYYAVRFAPPLLQGRLALAFAWRAELEQLIAKARDPGVARLKLDWWREELERTRRGAPRHPLTAELSEWLGEWQVLEPWYQMLEGAEIEVRKIQPAEQEDLASQCDLLGGAFGEVLCRAGAPRSEAEVDSARRLAGYHEAIRRMRELAAQLGRQRCPIPAAVLHRAGLAPDRLHQPAHRAALSACLAQCLDTLGAHPLRQLRAGGLRAHQPAAPAARLAAQAAALHRAMRRRDYAVLTEWVEITPLRRLWAAWRLR